MKTVTRFVCLFLLAACTQVQPVPTLHAPDYAKYGTTRLDVNDIQVINDYIPPYHAPNVEHELYLPPYVAVRDWARDRFQAVGNVGVAKIHVLDASIVKRAMPVKDDLPGYFSDQVNAEYRLHVHVRLEIISPNFDNQPFADVEVSRVLQTTEGMTVAQRDSEFHAMIVSMLDQLNQLMTKSIADRLSNVVK